MTTPAKKPEDRKKVIILGVLLAVAAVVLYLNVFSGDSSGPAITAPPVPQAAQAPAQAGSPAARREVSRVSVGEFKPRQGPARPEDRVDPATIDPTLRLDLLAKVQAVEPEQAVRNIFQYGAAPPPPAPPKPVIALPANPPKIAVNTPAPPPGRPGPPVTPVPGVAPPITLKYYGFKTSKANGRRVAFLLDGDEIIVAGENDSVKNGRYRIVRIGPTTITIEDTEFKASQTITLTEEPTAA